MTLFLFLDFVYSLVFAIQGPAFAVLFTEYRTGLETSSLPAALKINILLIPAN